MLNLFLQRLAPMITAFAMFLNSFSGILGLEPAIPYNPDRTEVVVSGDVTTDIKEILECYNSAVKKTGMVVGSSYIDIIGTPDVSVPNDTEIDMSAYLQALEETKTYVFEVPGNGELTVSDIKSAKMSVKDGRKSVIIKLKDTKEVTPDSPIAKGFGFTAGIEDGFEMAGFNVSGGEYDESFTECVISCVIGSNGKIIYGDWDSKGYMSIEDMTVDMFGYKVTMSMEYTAISHIDI